MRKVTFGGREFIQLEIREDYPDGYQKITNRYHVPDPADPEQPGQEVGHEIIDRGVLTDDTFRAGNYTAP